MSEVLSYTPPEPALLMAIGQVNFAWAELDALVSAIFIAALGSDPIEIGITIGKLETKAKLIKLQRIFKHRKEFNRFICLKEASIKIETNKHLRNSITHGRYMGKTTKGEHLWMLFSDFNTSADRSHTGLYRCTFAEIGDHLEMIKNVFISLSSEFSDLGLYEFYNLPSRTAL